jgi:hypothetical protein
VTEQLHRLWLLQVVVSKPFDERKRREVRQPKEWKYGMKGKRRPHVSVIAWGVEPPAGSLTEAGARGAHIEL